MAVCSRIRQYHPPSEAARASIGEAPARQPQRRRGRPKGTRTTAASVAVCHKDFLGVCYSAHPKIPPALWDLLCSLITALFRSILKLVGQLEVEGPGHQQERLFFVDLPKLLLGVARELANWWWSFDRGFLGTSLKCPKCGSVLLYRGDVKKEVMTPLGVIRPRRAYYRCSCKECGTSIRPLDQRLGLDGASFIPCLQEIVAWLTCQDPYGKSLQLVSKLLHFSVCHRSAWSITQKIGSLAKKRQEEAVARTFADPRSVVLPQAEVQPPEVGVVMFDGTCGRVDKGKETVLEEPDEEDPDAPPRPATFREIKLGLAAHLVPPVPKIASPKVGTCEAQTKESCSAVVSSGGNKPSPSPRKKRPRKVRLPGEEPTLAHKQLAVHLGTPLLLFQMVFLLIHRLGLDKAKTILAIGDGAHWIWKGVREHLSSLGVTVVEILDYWHGVEHLWKLANALLGQGTKDATTWVKSREGELLGGRLPDFFKSLEEALKKAKGVSEDLGKLVEKELNYFRNNECRIDYARYLAQGYLIGSGAMEGSCKNHVKERIDRSGMHWSVSGVMAVLRNRTLIKNGEWDDFWRSEAEGRWSRYQTLTATITR